MSSQSVYLSQPVKLMWHLTKYILARWDEIQPVKMQQKMAVCITWLFQHAAWPVLRSKKIACRSY